MFEHILVATAFDELSDLASELAIGLARLSDGRVTAVHVIESIGEDPSDPELIEFYGGLRGKAEENVRALAARFEEQGIAFDAVIRVGTRWELILQEADERAVDVIVLGSRPVLHQENPQLGTTSHQVFFASRKPLLIARK